MQDRLTWENRLLEPPPVKHRTRSEMLTALFNPVTDTACPAAGLARPAKPSTKTAKTA
jgi:hypothetical protein